MSHSDTPLATYQRWMRSVVTHPGSDTEAWMSRSAQAEIPLPRALELIESSPALSQMERVGIYRRMYFLRMRDSLALDFPGVMHAVGHDAFEDLVRDYCEVHPSRSYTLNHLGHSFPGFLSVLDIGHAAELAELARFELALTKLLDVDRAETLTAAHIRARTQSGLEGLYLKTVPGLCLMTLGHRCHDYLHRVNQEEEVPFPPEKQTTHLVIYQDEEFDIVWKEVSGTEYVLLSFFEEGMTLAQAMERLAAAEPATVGDALTAVGGWFSEWLQLGFFMLPVEHNER